MKTGKRTTRTINIEKIAEFFLLEFKTVEKQLTAETKLSNLHVKKAYSNLCNGLPYYDMNAILYEVCKELSELQNLNCRFTCEWEIREYESNKFKTTQGIDCWCNGKHHFTKKSGIEGINDILEQIGFEGDRLQDPETFLNLVVWK